MYNIIYMYIIINDIIFSNLVNQLTCRIDKFYPYCHTEKVKAPEKVQISYPYHCILHRIITLYTISYAISYTISSSYFIYFYVYDEKVRVATPEAQAYTGRFIPQSYVFQSQLHQILLGLYGWHMLPATLHKYKQLICSDLYLTGVD